MSNSSLSSVVSNLVRASMGASVPSTVTDGDLDRHVAELILKEAKQKAEKYAKEGIRAYLPQPDANVPKTNKRFLSSIIRHTDDHNKTILRAQALAAQEVRAERLEQEKQERRARAEEAVEAERLRRLMGGSSRSRRYRERDEQNDRKRRDRSWEKRSEEDPDWGRKKGKDRQDDSNRVEDRHRRHHRSRSPRREDESRHRSRHHRREKARSRDRDRSPSDDGSLVEEEKRKEKERYSERRHRSRRTERDSRRHRSRDRPRSDSFDSSHYHDRKRRRRSRSPSAARSDQEENHGDSKTDRSRHRKDDRAPSAALSEDPLTALDTLTGHPQENKRDGQGSKNPTGRKGVEKSHLHSPAALSEQDDLSSTSPNRPPMYKDETDGTCLVPSETLKPSSPKLSQPASRGPPRSHETSIAGPSSRLHSLSQRPSPSPSLSPGPRPPPPPTKSKSSHHRSRSSKAAPPPPSSSPPPLPAHLPSKMDRYFEESYDPRLDVAPLSAPTIPSTGLISDAEFAGWDAMLELIRQKRQDKEDKKRLERWGVDKDSTKKKKDSEPPSEAVDIMSIKYKKRGAVREWDLGKEGF